MTNMAGTIGEEDGAAAPEKNGAGQPAPDGALPAGNGAAPAGGEKAAPGDEKKYVASFSPDTPLPAAFAEAVLRLEKHLGMPVWLLVQDGQDHDLCSHVEELFFDGRHGLPKDQPVALLIESPGGQASSAYRIAKLLQRRCGAFTAVVARWAKSAATLLTLGASEIVLGEHAQLGPLDVQIFDDEREDMSSALNETQSLERLNAAALEAFDQTLYLLRMRVPKRQEALVPHALRFVAETMRPLFEKVDVVQYTNRSRTLKVAEEYAMRLLRANYPAHVVPKVARHLVERYPEHGFVIDFEESKAIGLRVREPNADETACLDQIVQHLDSLNVFGRVREA